MWLCWSVGQHFCCSAAYAQCIYICIEVTRLVIEDAVETVIEIYAAYFVLVVVLVQLSMEWL